MLLFIQLFQNLGWKVLQSLLMKPLVAMAMFEGREAGSAGREQNEGPHFHGVKERLESAKRKEKTERMRGDVSVINRRRYK